MRWSSIVKKDESGENQESVTVLDYAPKLFDFGTPGAAFDYLKEKQKGSDFVMSDVLRTTTGVEEIERLSEEKKIEQKVLEKIALIQEEAYKKAYNLGFLEGKQTAIESITDDLNEKIKAVDHLLESLSKIKEEMIYQTEAHVIKLVYDIASKLAFDHISSNDEVVLKIIKKAIEESQAEENIVVLVAKEQLEFLEKAKLSTGRDTEFIKNVKFEASENVGIGSCIVETNYGAVDARIQERVLRLWGEFKTAIPKVKTPIEST